jgi:hypothetical protein
MIVYLLSFSPLSFVACGLRGCSLSYLLTYLLSYSLTPYSTVLLEKLTGLQLVKKFPAFYGTRRFISAFTSAHYLSLSWASPYPSFHFLKISLNIILPSTSGSPQWSLSLRFPHQNLVHASPLPHPGYILRTSPFYHPYNSGWGVQIMNILIILPTWNADMVAK